MTVVSLEILPVKGVGEGVSSLSDATELQLSGDCVSHNRVTGPCLSLAACVRGGEVGE